MFLWKRLDTVRRMTEAGRERPTGDSNEGDGDDVKLLRFTATGTESAARFDLIVCQLQ